MELVGPVAHGGDVGARKQLKKRLKERGMSASGKKTALVMRLLNAADYGLTPAAGTATLKAPAPPTPAKTTNEASTKTVAREGTAGTGFGAVAKPSTRVVSRTVDSAEAAGEGGVKIKAKDPAHILKVLWSDFFMRNVLGH
jgi:hypothetical protein